ncbi:MAG: hypothetical protein M0Z33_09200 [Actinomycetota bacterium]|nr:hypothetical protein [Actinomycetota bacterium]
MSFELPPGGHLSRSLLGSGGPVASPVVSHVRLGEGPLIELRLEVDDGKLVRTASAHPEAPTRAVQHELGTSRRNATRWIAAARLRAQEHRRGVAPSAAPADLLTASG